MGCGFVHSDYEQHKRMLRARQPLLECCSCSFKKKRNNSNLHELDQDIVHAVAGWYIMQTSISGLSLRAGGPGD